MRIMIILLILSITSCGFFEPDQNFNNTNITGNILILNSEYFDSSDLMFKESEQIFAVIVGDCKETYFNEDENLILVSKDLTKNTTVFYEIQILNETAKYVSDALQKKEITKDEFMSRKVKFKKIEVGI